MLVAVVLSITLSSVASSSLSRWPAFINAQTPKRTSSPVEPNCPCSPAYFTNLKRSSSGIAWTAVRLADL
jgi:hypothetical protein